ncbi:MAG: nucleotidyltransferase domain-containing protein [Deltaproteobacteria bacterium]|nr:nucleotidyltransferase domain-containing protein [Deltaproteobacteria bacterium]
MITKNEALNLIKQYKNRFGEKYGIQEIGIFGSVARETNTEESDVDVVIKIHPPSLITMSHIRIDLEEMMHRHVDLIHYREKMNSFLKQRIESEAVYV